MNKHEFEPDKHLPQFCGASETCALPASADIHQVSTSDVQAEVDIRVRAPERIWLFRQNNRWLRHWFTPNLPPTDDSNGTEYVRSDICAALVEALEGLYVLIEKGDLVRDITNDDEFSSFAAQGLRITKAFNSARTAIAQAREEGVK